jgi:hypothetical protein
MKILIACEWSGRVRDAFQRLGHDAYSCDLQPGKGEYSQFHIRGDVFDVIDSGIWDAMIAFPPCTYLATIGNYYGTNYQANAITFVKDLWDTDIPGRTMGRIGHDTYAHAMHNMSPVALFM